MNRQTTNEVPSVMLPWNDWTEPEVIQTDLHAIEADLDEEERLILKIHDGEGSVKQYGEFSSKALKELSLRVQFPTEFIQKLSPDLRPLVINDRIAAIEKNQKFSFMIGEDGNVSASSPGWREVVPHREIAQISYETLLSNSEVDSVSVHFLDRNEANMKLRLITPLETPITPARGDILQMGIDIQHSFGTDLHVSLFTNRLVCTNGMTAIGNEYSWHSDAAKTKGRQIEWLREAVLEAIEQYDVVIARSHQMANTTIQGDLTSALYQRARSLGIPRRFHQHILEAFNAEPGNTEWALTNALTRFASHNPDRELGERIQRAAGNMVENFKMSTARVPLYIAQTGGFEILSTEDEQSALTD